MHSKPLLPTAYYFCSWWHYLLDLNPTGEVEEQGSSSTSTVQAISTRHTTWWYHILVSTNTSKQVGGMLHVYFTVHLICVPSTAIYTIHVWHKENCMHTAVWSQTICTLLSDHKPYAHCCLITNRMHTGVWSQTVCTLLSDHKPYAHCCLITNRMHTAVW
jgi:hypothetical protein